MPTEQRNRPGPKPKPAALKRTEWIKVRATPLEKAAAEARAEHAGMEFSSYVRQAVCGEEPPAREERRRQYAEDKAGIADFQARVRRLEQTMPRRSAEIAARREMQRRAKTA